MKFVNLLKSLSHLDFDQMQLTEEEYEEEKAAMLAAMDKFDQNHDPAEST